MPLAAGPAKTVQAPTPRRNTRKRSGVLYEWRKMFASGGQPGQIDNILASITSKADPRRSLTGWPYLPVLFKPA